MGKYQKTKYPGIFKYVGKNGESYGIDYYAGGKKHREIVGPLLTEAQEKLAELRKSARDGGYMSLAARRKFTFDQLAKEYEEKQKGETYFDKTRKYYVPIIKAFFGNKRLYQISPLDVENYKKQRKETPTRAKKPRSEVAVNRELETLRHIFNKAVDWGFMEKNPFDKFRDPILFKEDENRVRYLTEDEIKRLFAVLEEKPKIKRKPLPEEEPIRKNNPSYLKNIVKAALLTGLRRGDLLSLKWADVDLEKGVLFFNEQKKRNRRRIKVLNSDMIDLLKSIPRGESETIFNGPDGKPLKDIKRSFRTALKKAKIRDFHFHDLRHTSASYMVMRGASLKAVQEHLGHTSLIMTQRYAHLSPEFQRAEVERLSGVFSGGIPDSKNLVRNDQNADLLYHPGIHANA
jgi:integrase